MEKHAKHTPTPWTLASNGTITQTHHITRDVWTIPHRDGDMEFIVRACNAHDDLVAALIRAKDHLIMSGTACTDAPEALAQARAAIGLEAPKVCPVCGCAEATEAHKPSAVK